MSCGFCLAVVYLLIRAVTADRAVALLAAALPPGLELRDVPRHHQRGHHAEYSLLVAAIARSTSGRRAPRRAGRGGVGAVLARLADGIAPDVPHPARPAGRPLALRGATGVAAGLDRPVPRRHARHGLRGGLGLAGPRQIGRTLRADWTGKAVRSVWAGFTWPKVGYMWDGMVAYLLGAGVAALPGIPGWDIWRYTATVWMLAVAAVALPMLWRARHDPRARALAAVFGGTFVAGRGLQPLFQPQDPQMQINVMAWLTVGWALVLVAVRAPWRQGPRRPGGADGGAVRLQCVEPRSRCAAWTAPGSAHLRDWNARPNPARTVWLMHDFDWMMVYASLHWGIAEPGTDELGPAPQATPKFEWISLTARCCAIPTGATNGRSPTCGARSIAPSTLGYDVLVVRLWDMDLPRLETAAGMVASNVRLAALRRLLHDDYVATPVFNDPVAGAIYRLQRKPGR